MTSPDATSRDIAGTPTARRPGAKLLTLLFAVLLLGGIAMGMGIERYVVLPHQMHGWHGRGGFGDHAGMRGGPGRGGFGGPIDRERRDAMRDRLRSELGLSDAQVHKMDSIMATQEAAVAALQNETRPRFEALMHETHAKIDSVLTPAQRAIHDRHRPTPPEPRP